MGYTGRPSKSFVIGVDDLKELYLLSAIYEQVGYDVLTPELRDRHDLLMYALRDRLAEKTWTVQI